MGATFLVSLLLLTSLTVVQGWIFPYECVVGYNGTRRPCCPSYNGSVCGSKDNRGNCMLLRESRSQPPPDVIVDERFNFPSFFFTATCQCKPNFMGPACGECALGLTGDKCDQPNVVFRRNIQSLTKKEFTTYLAELHYCKFKMDVEFAILTAVSRFHRNTYRFSQGSYTDTMCFIHTYVTRPFINKTEEHSWLNFAHGSTGFLSWHRLYLLLFERQIQKCLSNPSWGLLYYSWEYEDPRNCSICDNNYFGASDAHGRIDPESVISSWRMVCGGLDYSASVCLMEDCVSQRPRIVRKVGLENYAKSTLSDVASCMDMPVDSEPYDSSSVNSARNCIEGFRNARGRSGVFMHNAVHMFIGGTMSKVPVSCNDPLFYSHHCNVDKIFEEYIQYNDITPSQYPPNPTFGHTPDSCIGPLIHCWKQKSMYGPISWWNVYYV